MKTLLVIEPGSTKRYPGLHFSIGTFMQKNNMKICLEHTAKPDKKFWEDFFQIKEPTVYSVARLKYLTSSSSSFFIIEGGDDVVEKVRQYVTEIRTRYGIKEKDTKGVAHASEIKENAHREIEFVIESMFRGRL